MLVFAARFFLALIPTLRYICQFGNRLWALMSKNGYDTPRKLAIALFDAELVTVNSKPNGYTTDEEIRKNAIGSVEKKIAKHEASGMMVGTMLAL